MLVKAFAGLDDARLWIVGNGHRASQNQQLAERLRLKNVTFWGSLPDKEIISCLRQAHVLVLPSVTTSEAFGLVLLEGMAAGCVPVASRLPGVTDVLGPAGLSFAPGDSDALSRILQKLQEQPDYRLALAGLAQQRAYLYNWEQVISGYSAIFEHAVNRTGSSPVIRWPDSQPSGEPVNL